METSESETKSTGRQWYNRCLLSLLKALGQAYTNPEKIVCVHLKWQLQTKFHFRPSQYTLLYFIPVLNFFWIFESGIFFVSDVKKAKTEKVATKTSSKEGASGGPKDKTPTPLSIQKDPKTSATYKSLFTSSNKAKNQQSAHWVTYNPFYNWLSSYWSQWPDYKSTSLKIV